jgi:hypothetical protein
MSVNVNTTKGVEVRATQDNGQNVLAVTPTLAPTVVRTEIGDTVNIVTQTKKTNVATEAGPQVFVTAKGELVQVNITDGLPMPFPVPGPQGDPGVSGGSYTHNQDVAASTWTINHNLGYKPAGIKIFDSAGNECYGTIISMTTNQIIINFGTAGFTGQAFLS